MNNALEASKAEVARLEAEAAAEERQRLIGELASVREQHRAGLEHYRKLAAQIKAERAARASTWAKVANVNEAIREWMNKRPAVADFLPDDPEVKNWSRRHAELEQLRAEALAAHNELPDPERNIIEAASYEGFTSKIAALEFSESNVLRRLEGGGSGKSFAFKSGVYGVA